MAFPNALCRFIMGLLETPKSLSLKADLKTLQGMTKPVLIHANALSSSVTWRHYFEHNAQTLMPIPWGETGDLSTAERHQIAASVQNFQVGESSEGRHLLQAAQRYAQQVGDGDYVAAIRLFIAEEQRHARDLGQFLDRNHIPLLKTTPQDRAFRWLRRRFNSLEVSIAVLITAEIIATVYYAALREATQSPTLQALCQQILHDEAKHVQFQVERLHYLRRHRPWPLQTLTMTLQRGLFGLTSLAIWPVHQPVFRLAGLSFQEFWRAGWQAFDASFTAPEA